MEKDEYLYDLYERSYELNSTVMYNLYKLNFNNKYREKIEHLLENDRVIYSELGKRIITSMSENSKVIDKVIARLESDMAHLEQLQQDIAIENKFLLN